MPGAAPRLSYRRPLLLGHDPSVGKAPLVTIDHQPDFLDASGGLAVPDGSAPKFLLVDEFWSLFGTFETISFAGKRHRRYPDPVQAWTLLVYGSAPQVQTFFDDLCEAGSLDEALGFSAAQAFVVVEEREEAVLLQWQGTLEQRDTVFDLMSDRFPGLGLAFNPVRH